MPVVSQTAPAGGPGVGSHFNQRACTWSDNYVIPLFLGREVPMQIK
ncbi:MAG: hypothetical protein ACTSQ8_23210 [Candidatus Helarchaeota archaeon]